MLRRTHRGLEFIVHGIHPVDSPFTLNASQFSTLYLLPPLITVIHFLLRLIPVRLVVSIPQRDIVI